MILLNKHVPLLYEVVERKCLGHPDTLADGISEAISRALCRVYLDEFGLIQHHNVDKVLIIAGKSAPCFSGGDILVPPAVVVGGRASRPAAFPLDDIVREATASHLKCTLKHLDLFDVEPRLEEGAPELRSLIGRGANDTSIGVGYAPLSETEKLVLDLEEVVRGVPGSGEDIKLMAVAGEGKLTVVVAVAMVSQFINSREEYDQAKETVREVVMKNVKAKAEAWRDIIQGGEVEVYVNCADTAESIYLTVTGSSIEMGDDGATGRGNRGNGLITPMRPMTMEAIAGKNPVSHVGKIYNVLAQKAAAEIAELDWVEEAYVTFVSKIGSAISQPLLRGVQISGDGTLTPGKGAKVDGIIDYWLESTEDLVELFVQGKLILY